MEIRRPCEQDQDYFAPTVVSAASKATEGKGFWESIPAWFAEVSKDPFDYTLYIAGSSAGAIAPFLATSMAGGFALNAMKLNSVARAVQAATMGAGSFTVEFGSYIENYLAEKGYDLSNIESIKSALDKEDVNAIREKAFRRAAVVGAFDAISAWIAPIRLNPSNSLRLLNRAATETVQDVAVPASRLHRVGRKIKENAGLTSLVDIGFRCLRLDESNMENVYYAPDEVKQELLFSQVDNVKPDRTPEDLLFQVMLDLGVLLSSPIKVKEIAGKKVFDVAEGFLLACFDKDVTNETVKAIAQKKPYYAVFRDNSMANDSVATNFDQIFETYSPDTVRKVL